MVTGTLTEKMGPDSITPFNSPSPQSDFPVKCEQTFAINCKHTYEFYT